MRRSISFLSLLPLIGFCLSCRSSVSPAPIGAARPAAPAAPLVLAEELKQMRRSGLPILPEELQAPLPHADRNAAPLYRQLDALLKAKPVTGADKIATDGVGHRPLTAEKAAQLRVAFQNRADIGRLIHSAAERPECVFDRKWAQGSAMMFPEFARMRLTARWLSAESALQLYDGKPLDAIKTQAMGFRLAHHAAQDPMLIALLVADAIDAITLAGMERILYVAGDQPGIAQAIQQTLQTGWIAESLAHALRGEMILPLVELEKYRKNSPEAYEKSLQQYAQMGVPGTQPQLTTEDKQHWSEFVDRTEAIMLRNLRSLIASADKPYPESHLVFEKVSSDLEAHSQDAAYMDARIVFPVYVQSTQKQAQTAAKVATVRAVEAILTWKTQHGKFPNLLQDAMTQVPTDPFNGNPLSYKQEGNGFVVYSVGPTGKFGGGTPDVKPDVNESLFRYPMPAYIK